MARPSSASTPGSSKRKREDGTKLKKSHKNKAKKAGEEAQDMRKMDSPAVQRAKREIKIRRLTLDQINALESAFDAAGGKLSHPQKVEIAKGIGLEARQVAIWFQNRRAKWRTEQVESQYDVLQKQNQRLMDENERLKKELEETRHALAVARSGIAHPTPSRMEPVTSLGGASFYGSKDGESPGAVYEKLQNLLKSMKGKGSAFLSAAAAGHHVGGSADEDDSSESASDSSGESSEEEHQPIKRARRSALPKRGPALPVKPTPTAPPPGTRSSTKSPSTAPAADKQPKGPPKASKLRVQRDTGAGRPSTLQRRGSKLEALQLPVKMNPTMPLFADKDRLKPPAEAPTPRMGRGKPGTATPGSTPAMWLGPRSDPSPTTGPLAPGEQQQQQTPSAAEPGSAAAAAAAAGGGMMDKVPPSAVGRGFSHLMGAGVSTEGSPTDSTLSPSAFLLSDGNKEPSPTSGAMLAGGAGGGSASTQPSPLGTDDAAKEARLQLGLGGSEWGGGMRSTEVAGSRGMMLAADGEDAPELPTEVARDFSRGFGGGGDYGRSASPPLPQLGGDFPNSAAQDFLAKYRAVYGEIHRSSERGVEGATSSSGYSHKAADILAFVNGTDVDVDDRRGSGVAEAWRSGGGGGGGASSNDPLDAAGLAQRLAALDGTHLHGGTSSSSMRGLDALAVLALGGRGAREEKGERGGGGAALDLSLESGSGVGASRAAQLLGEASARSSAPSTTGSRLARGTSFLGSASAFEAFRGGGNLLDPYQDPPFAGGLREERALSPSLREAISQHHSGQVTQTFLTDEPREETAGPLTPRLGGQVQQGMPPWLTAVANNLWADSGSPGVTNAGPGWWTQFQAGQG